MAYFWVLTQFLSDSSSYLINAFSGYLQGPEVNSKDEDPWEANPKIYQSKSVQAGSGIISEHLEVSIQCPVSLHKKTNRTTSIYQVKCFDRYTGTHTLIDKIDVSTDPEEKKICEKHCEVYATLKQWPLFKVTLKSVKDQRPKRFTRFKSRLMSALNIFNPTKIQNLPYENLDNGSKTLRLYRCASIENMDSDQFLTVKCISNKKNKKKMQKIK